MVKRVPAMWETRVRFLGREDPLEKEMAMHSSILAWKIPWTEEPDRLQSMGSQSVRHDWVTSLILCWKTFLPWWASEFGLQLGPWEFRILDACIQLLTWQFHLPNFMGISSSTCQKLNSFPCLTSNSSLPTFQHTLISYSSICKSWLLTSWCIQNVTDSSPPQLQSWPKSQHLLPGSPPQPLRWALCFHACLSVVHHVKRSELRA